MLVAETVDGVRRCFEAEAAFGVLERKADPNAPQLLALVVVGAWTGLGCSACRLLVFDPVPVALSKSMPEMRLVVDADVGT